jgi:DNA polymerase
MTAESKKELSGVEGLSVYLRYLKGHFPEMVLTGEGKTDILSKPDSHSEPSMASGRIPKEMALSEVAELASHCHLCALSERRRNVVFGEGNPDASLMFVGEGPGADEDATGRPFVGKAGELLTKMILAMGFDRSQVYIANIVKCRPPGNRPPEESERISCLPYLHRQISIVSPGAIILLGQTAASGLLRSVIGISRLRGRETRIPEFPAIRVLPTYHPAYLLRNPSAKVHVWEDLKMVMGWLKEGKE